MTIHHFLITAGYIFWAYIMLYITIKLIHDAVRNIHMDRKSKSINNLFFCENPKEIGRFNMLLILFFTRNNIFFENLCRYYTLKSESFTASQKEFFSKFIVHAIEYKIKITPLNDTLTRTLLICCIGMCSARSIKIDKFLMRCKTGCKLERNWIESYDELNKIALREKR